MDYETPQFYRVGQYARAADRDVVDMVSGDPDWEPPTALRAGLREYADAGPDEYQYAPSVGLDGLREEIAARRGIDPERIIVTHGVAEGNHLATHGALETAEGNGVLLTDPVYPYYAGRANLLGAETTFVAVDDSGHLDPAAVQDLINDNTALVVVNSPNNPLGVTYDPAAVREIGDIAAAHGALLLADEVYDHFDYSGRFESALTADTANTVVTNSFSKSLGITGFRVGYAVFPPSDAPDPWGRLLDRARTRHMLTTISGSRPAQAAVLRALRETGPDYYADLRHRVRDRIAVFTDALDAAGAAYTEPEGAFYVMARFPDTDGSFGAARRMIDEAGVAGMPGEAFGAARADWFRFALVTPRVETAAARLEAYFD